MKDERGFLILEILIAGLILTASIAAAMSLLRIGSEGLQRAVDSNTLSSKLPQAISLIESFDLANEQGSEDMGEGVLLGWKASLLEMSRPEIKDAVIGKPAPGMHELYLYQVEFTLDNGNVKREYKLNVFRYKTLVSPSGAVF